jgi:hypothetical protein
MKVVKYNMLPMGTSFRRWYGDRAGVNLYSKGEDTDFDEAGNMIAAEYEDAEVFVEDEPATIEETPASEHTHPDQMKRDSVWALVERELSSAQYAHSPMNSHHEAYGVILEEVDEYWAEVKKKAKDRRPSEVRAELVQIAAMACRAIIDLDLL